MRLSISGSGFRLWLSKYDTYAWATRPGASWPCSTLRNRRVVVEFDRGGLVDLCVNGGRGDQDLDAHELTACVSDYVRTRLPADNPAACYVRSPT